MSQWSDEKNSGGSPIWGPALVNKPVNETNRDSLFNNQTEDAFITDAKVGVYAVPTEALTSGGVLSVSIIDSGNGYTAQPNVSFSGGDGSGAEADVIAKVNEGTLDIPGTSGSYVPGEFLYVAGGTGDAANFSVDATEVRTVTIVDAGNGYVNNDVVELDTGEGTAATFTVTTGAADTIPASLALTTRGEYTTNPTLVGATTTATGASEGSGLTVTVTMRVKTLTLQEVGAYSALPTLANNQLTGGSGGGASANLTIGVKEVLVTNTGSGFTSAPNVVFGGTGGSGSNGVALLTLGGQVASSGWVLRTEGTGGRAGRVQYEVLSVVSSMKNPS